MAEERPDVPDTLLPTLDQCSYNQHRTSAPTTNALDQWTSLYWPIHSCEIIENHSQTQQLNNSTCQGAPTFPGSGSVIFFQVLVSVQSRMTASSVFWLYCVQPAGRIRLDGHQLFHVNAHTLLGKTHVNKLAILRWRR